MPSNDVLNPEISRLKLAQIQLMSGGLSSICEVCVVNPLDVVKTRLQLQTHKTAKLDHHYAGVADAFSKIYRQEGLAAFWRGIIPPLLSDTPRRALKFMAFEQLLPVFLFGSSKPTGLTNSLAGGFAGVTEALLSNPFEVIKITQQANRKVKLNTIAVAKTIIQNEGWGLRGLYRGINALIIRNFIFHVMYFGVYTTLRDKYPPCEEKSTEFLRRCGLAVISGWLGNVSSIPFDVAKSRIQGPQPVKGKIKYSSAWKTVATIYREEGIRALYKGLMPQMMRGAPSAVILLVGYEYVYNILINNIV